MAGSNTDTDTIGNLGSPDVTTAGLTKVYKESEEVQFTDNSEGAVTTFWDFGDGETTFETNPKHYYYENGEYVVKLVATNYYGESSQEQTVIVSGIGVDYYEVEELEPMPTYHPAGFNPPLTMQVGTLSEQGRWTWNGAGWELTSDYLPPEPPPESPPEPPQEVMGCTDPSAFNYNPDANTDDGSCVPVILGCIDSTATNYNLDANTDDGSCEYGERPPEETAFVTLTGTLMQTIPNDSSLWAIQNTSDNSLIQLITGGTNISISRTSGESLGNFTIKTISGNNIALVTPVPNTYTGIIVTFSLQVEAPVEPEILGCTDPSATNYEPTATVDDGSCTYSYTGP